MRPAFVIISNTPMTIITIPPIGNDDRILMFFIVINNLVVVINKTVVFLVVDGGSVVEIVSTVGNYKKILNQ